MESNSAIEIEPDFTNCRQWLHNFIKEQQFRFSFFNLNSVWEIKRQTMTKKTLLSLIINSNNKKMAVPCIHDIFCRLAPAAASAASANPYLQSMYAAMAGQASNPYAQLQGTGLISLAQAQNQLISQAATPAQAGTTGNPLLDAYGQYAAQLAAAQQVYTTTANQQQLTASSAIDAQASKFFARPYIINVGWKTNAYIIIHVNY